KSDASHMARLSENQSLTSALTVLRSTEMNPSQKCFSLKRAASKNKSPSVSVSRRRFIAASSVAASAFAIVPRHVLGGPGFVPPSEKITLACVGFGTQAIREIGGILASPEVQVVAMCDVEKDGSHYLEWSKNEVR